jgi:hypothetical protein
MTLEQEEAKDLDAVLVFLFHTVDLLGHLPTDFTPISIKLHYCWSPIHQSLFQSPKNFCVLKSTIQVGTT